MAADADTILSAVEAVLNGLYSTIPTRKRRRSARGGHSRVAGWTPGDPLPVFILSMSDPEPVDEIASFETVFVRYRIDICYCKANPPGGWDEDTDVRDKRAAIRAALYKPTLTGATVVSDIRFESGEPYTEAAGGNQTASVSTETLTFLAHETRGHN